MAALATLFAVLVLLPTPTGYAATELAKWHAALLADREQLADLRSELAEARADAADVRERRTRLMAQVQERLVSIYKAGGTDPMHHLGVARGSVKRAGDVADAVNTVARHDDAVLQEVRDLDARLRVLGKLQIRLQQQIGRTQNLVRKHERSLAAAVKRAKAARERAERMARVAESPLAPRALAPETIEINSAADSSQPAPAPAPSGYTETGEASIYHDNFTGEATASGEPYNPSAMTAAHKTLPLGTWVVVSGPGGTAIVRINDRGPFEGARIIDLSPAAAAAVGVNGLGNVTISVQG